MKHSVVNFIERYFMNQVDRALDDGVPLTGLTAWYVRRNPEFRKYHEHMLGMELELCFSETEAVIRPPIFPSLYAVSAKSIRYIPLTVAAVLLFALGITVYFLPSKTSVLPEPIYSARRTMEDEPTIDLAVLFVMPTGFSFEPVEPKLPLDDTVVSLARFTEQPLESTLVLLESAHIITRQPLDSDER